eukprot:jgi/Ulvmu1/205/UM001_0209.1
MLRCLQRHRGVLYSLDWHQLYSTGCVFGDSGSVNEKERYDNATRQHKEMWLLSRRSCAVGTRQDTVEPEKAVSAATEVLRQIAVRKLRTRLEEESQKRLSMPVHEVLAWTQDIVNVNNADSREILRALQTSGAILQHDRQVFLRPQEVAEIVLQAIPDTEDEAERKCKEIEGQLLPLQQEFEKNIESKARLRSTLLAYAGLGLLVAQFAFFVRIVYWDLSWDVVEPLTFFNSQLTAILAYTYFLVYRHDFTAETHYKAVIGKEKSKLIQKHRFDYERYHLLQQDLNRWKNFAKTITRR